MATGKFKKYTQSVSAPPNPSMGDEWYDTASGTLYKFILYNNVTQWVSSAGFGDLALPTWTSATRPSMPSNGQMGYNSSLLAVEAYISGVWQNSAARVVPAIELLIVAGGGAGGGKFTPGGGAGGLLYYGNNSTTKTPNGGPLALVKGTTYTIAVGAGGVADTSGTASSFIGGTYNLSATGGGKNAVAGGSGGGGGGTGTVGQGNNGGTSNANAFGGGGGAGSVGKNAAPGTKGGGGGDGLRYPEFAVNLGSGNGFPNGIVTGGWFAGGGGGGGNGTAANGNIGGPGGPGGGGAGGYGPYVNSTGATGSLGNPGIAYTGAGGGGTSDLHVIDGGRSTGFGGGGIVILSYAGALVRGTGGTIDTTTRPGYVMHIFTGGGAFVYTG